ncbi:MAG: hypothetical protein GX673_10835 [Gammaproteobacteria bacterium]|nr:hypothetical protein [Gammaproteobacteria bacterium]
MQLNQFKPLLKCIAPLLLACASSTVFAANEACVQTLFDYADTLPVEKLGAKVSAEVTKEANEHGAPGEMISYTTYSSGQNWITIRECPSCQPKKSRTGANLVASEQLPCGLKKGLTVAQITQALGQPDEIEDDRLLSYYTDEHYTNSVVLELDDSGKLGWVFNNYY